MAACADGGQDTLGELDSWGGVFTFPEAKRRYYAGNTLLWLGQGNAAATESTAAISAYECGPPGQRSYGDEACAGADVVAALARAGDVAAAWVTLQPLIELPPAQRVAGLAAHLAVAGRDLDVLTCHATVADLREGIRLALPATGPG